MKHEQRECLNDAKLFYPKQKRSRFCSDACGNEYRARERAEQARHPNPTFSQTPNDVKRLRAILHRLENARYDYLKISENHNGILPTTHLYGAVLDVRVAITLLEQKTTNKYRK